MIIYNYTCVILAIVLSVLRFIDSDYSLRIFKFFFCICMYIVFSIKKIRRRGNIDSLHKYMTAQNIDSLHKYMTVHNIDSLHKYMTAHNIDVFSISFLSIQSFEWNKMFNTYVTLSNWLMLIALCGLN
jgi:hypothetical protein